MLRGSLHRRLWPGNGLASTPCCLRSREPRPSLYWKVVGTILESLVFILIGLSLRGVLQRLGGNWEAIGLLVPAISAIIITVILTRSFGFFPPPISRGSWSQRCAAEIPIRPLRCRSSWSV